MDPTAHGYSLTVRRLVGGAGATWQFAGTPPSLAASRNVRDSGEALDAEEKRHERESGSE